MNSFFQENLIQPSRMISPVAIYHWQSPCEYSVSLRIHKVEIFKLFIPFSRPCHLLLHVIRPYSPLHIWPVKPVPLLNDGRPLHELLLNYIPFNLTQYTVFLFQIVYPVLIVNHSTQVAVEARPKDFAESGTLRADARETPEE